MNVRITPTEAPTQTKLYTSIINVHLDDHCALTMQSKDGESITLLVEDYLEFSVDNDGAVT